MDPTPADFRRRAIVFFRGMLGRASFGENRPNHGSGTQMIPRGFRLFPGQSTAGTAGWVVELEEFFLVVYSRVGTLRPTSDFRRGDLSICDPSRAGGERGRRSESPRAGLIIRTLRAEPLQYPPRTRRIRINARLSWGGEPAS